MKNLDFGKTVSVLANMGVIAGIVFLAVELRQNNDLLRSQARSNLDASRVEMQQNLVQNSGGIAELVHKARIGDDLTPVEEWRLNIRRNMMLLDFESMYREVQTGPLEEVDLPERQWARAFSNDPGFMDVWTRARDSMDSDFVRYMEARVLPMIETSRYGE